MKSCNIGNVRICIHQSADKIGGNCIEIVAKNGERLLLDAGRPLDISSKEKTLLPNSLDVSNQVAGVLISHAHADHFGMLESIPLSWKIFCGKITKSLIEFNTAFLENKLNNTFISLKKGNNAVGAFKIKPFLIDHSAIDAYAFLIEVDGKRIFYSGDIRAHGRKAKLTQSLIDNPPKNIDVLLLEGTNLITAKSDAKSTKSEEELENGFVEAFNSVKNNKIFATWSAQNLDRVVTIYKAANKAKRKTVVDLYSMYILTMLAKHGVTIPNPEWEKSNLLAVVTSKMTRLLSCKIGKEKCDDYIEYLKKKHCARSVSGIAKEPEKYVILVRDGLVDDYSKTIEGKIPLVPTPDDLWIWSMWSGYLKEDSTLKTRNYLKDCKKQTIHTSGHAPTAKLIEIVEAIKPKMLIPIHGENWKENKDLFNNINIIENGQWLELQNKNNSNKQGVRTMSFKRNFIKIAELKDDALFKTKLLPDIKRGSETKEISQETQLSVEEGEKQNQAIKKRFVFPAIRDGHIDFYWRGGKLFSYNKVANEFTTHQKYASVLVSEKLKKTDDYISQPNLTSCQLITNFTDGYERIKENCGNYSGLEALGVSVLYEKYSCVANADKTPHECPYVVLDIEASFKRENEDSSRSQDRIDMLILNRIDSSLHFVEAKHFSNKELSEKGEKDIKVIEQIEKYEKQIEDKKDEILDAYKNYVKALNNIFYTKIEEPFAIDKEVRLLIFGFDDDQKKGKLATKIYKGLGDRKNLTYAIGDIKACELKNIFGKQIIKI